MLAKKSAVFLIPSIFLLASTAVIADKNSIIYMMPSQITCTATGVCTPQLDPRFVTVIGKAPPGVYVFQGAYSNNSSKGGLLKSADYGGLYSNANNIMPFNATFWAVPGPGNWNSLGDCFGSCGFEIFYGKK